MLGLEDCMDIRSLHQQGLSVSEIARRDGIDRRTVRKYLREAPRELPNTARIMSPGGSLPNRKSLNYTPFVSSTQMPRCPPLLREADPFEIEGEPVGIAFGRGG
jgi:hypothetical protein